MPVTAPAGSSAYGSAVGHADWRRDTLRSNPDAPRSLPTGHFAQRQRTGNRASHWPGRSQLRWLSSPCARHIARHAHIACNGSELGVLCLAKSFVQLAAATPRIQRNEVSMRCAEPMQVSFCFERNRNVGMQLMRRLQLLLCGNGGRQRVRSLSVVFHRDHGSALPFFCKPGVHASHNP